MLNIFHLVFIRLYNMLFKDLLILGQTSNWVNMSILHIYESAFHAEIFTLSRRVTYHCVVGEWRLRHTKYIIMDVAHRKY